MTRKSKTPSVLLVLCACVLCASAADSSDIPENVIVMISDGCGYNHVLATNYYQHGAAEKQVYERFPVRVGMSTWSTDTGGYEPERAAADLDYLDRKPTDSAAAATAMSTGVKTCNGAIGVDPSGRALRHLAERAEELGKATGVVSSVPLSHATPAGFAVHNPSRGNYAEIARSMILDSALDLIMGCGNPFFDDDGEPLGARDTDERSEPEKPDYHYVGGPDTWRALVEGRAGGDADGDGAPDPWLLIQERGEFECLASGGMARVSRLIGVTQVASTLQVGRGDSRGDEAETALPFEVPLNDNVPDLPLMSRGALNLLARNPAGFFLMIEGGAVDWASHGNSSERMIEEELDFSEAVETVVKWVERHGDWRETLLIVTGDHECGGLRGPGSDTDRRPLVNHGEGRLPGMEWGSTHHTNDLIPFYAKGAGSSGFVERAEGRDPRHGAYIDNTDLARVVFQLWDR